MRCYTTTDIKLFVIQIPFGSFIRPASFNLENNKSRRKRNWARLRSRFAYQVCVHPGVPSWRGEEYQHFYPLALYTAVFWISFQPLDYYARGHGTNRDYLTEREDPDPMRGVTRAPISFDAYGSLIVFSTLMRISKWIINCRILKLLIVSREKGLVVQRRNYGLIIIRRFIKNRWWLYLLQP